ncbi:hypothetical protein TNCV_4703671 [Trichonephila clavipes]|nr:hypothetical protein TNCV_4703671 [Trichonephila clavipes]
MVDKDILEFVQSSINVTDADSHDENEMNNAVPVPISSEMRNVMKIIRIYREWKKHSNGEKKEEKRESPRNERRLSLSSEK